MAAVLPPPLVPKFNHYGDYVVSNSPGRLLPHQMDLKCDLFASKLEQYGGGKFAIK